MPKGAGVIGTSVVVNGLSAYAFTVLAARALGPEHYASLAALSAVVFVLGPGFFLPFEQEITRLVAAGRAMGSGARGAFTRLALLATASAVVLIVLALTVGRGVLDRLFDHDVLLIFAFCGAILSYLSQNVMRGLYAGSDRFDLYALGLGAEGVIRVAGGVILFLDHTRSPGEYGLALGLAPLFACALVVLASRGLLPSGPSPAWPEALRAIGYLIGGTLFTQLLANAPPIVVLLLASTSQRAAVGRFYAGFVVMRVPLFLFLAIQVTVLPMLAAAAAHDRYEHLRDTVRSLVGALVAVMGLAVIAAAIVGRPSLRLVFGRAFLLGRTDLVLLAAASGALMIATLLAQALIAVRSHELAAASWLAGLACFGVGMANSAPLIARVEYAFLVGSFAAAVAAALLLRMRLSRAVKQRAG